nr:AlNc14C1023G12723 [Albugo laibachii Nc14]|eukprot:CCA28049.1 AlNc14C1023G12723 [Albugo laibachii Nc14]
MCEIGGQTGSMIFNTQLSTFLVSDAETPINCPLLFTDVRKAKFVDSLLRAFNHDVFLQPALESSTFIGGLYDMMVWKFVQSELVRKRGEFCRGLHKY